MSTPAVCIDVRPDAVAVLTIDQPESKVNVLTPALVAELEVAVDSLAARTDLKGLVIASGKPGVFIAGADIKVFANAPGPNDPAVRAYIEHGLRVLEKLEALPFPTCAAIDGAALGGGLELALACDYRVCGTNPKVQMGLPEVKLGLIPGWGGTQRLPRVIHAGYAAQMLWSGGSINTRQAYGRSLIAWYPRAGDVVGEAAAFLLELIPMDWEPWESRRRNKQQPVANSAESTVSFPLIGPVAQREVVCVIIEGANLPLADGIKLETEAFLRLAGSDESKRLIAEFFASRKK